MAAWDKREDETPAAYNAFTIYSQLPARERSIDAAWRAADRQQDRSGKRAPGHWMGWSSKHEWVARAAAYDEYLAEQDRLLWEERRRQLKERDWEQADRIRGVVDEAIPHAQQFIRRRTTTIRGHPALMDENGNITSAGTPDREITTIEFDIAALARVLETTSKVQRLASNEPTEHIQLTGAALDAYIASQLERIAHGGEAGTGGGFEPDDAETDGATDGDGEAV